jgi:hypothetical protein
VISHGLITPIYVGSKPLVPQEEVERILREGLPNVPSGYKPGARKRVQRRAKVKAKRTPVAHPQGSHR